jgi:hypothetical protein
LLRLLPQCLLAHGYRTHRWTTERIAEIMATHCGVTDPRDHIGLPLAVCD